MIAPLQHANVPAQAWPTILFTRRKLSSDLPPARVDDSDPSCLNVVVDREQLTLRGAYYLFAAIRRNLSRGHWRRACSGLLLRTAQDTDRVAPSWPTVTFESVHLNTKAPVMIVDHPQELRVLVDDRELTDQGAVILTDAVREHMSNGQWQRAANGLWLTA